MKTSSLLAVLVLLDLILVQAVSLVDVQGQAPQENINIQAALEHTCRAVALATRSDRGWIGTEQIYVAYRHVLKVPRRTEASAKSPPPRVEPPVAGEVVTSGEEASDAIATGGPIGSTLVIRNDPALTDGLPGVFRVVYDDQWLLGDRGIYGRLWGNRIFLPGCCAPFLN